MKCLALVALVLLQQLVSGRIEVRTECDDALHPDTGLCKRWNREGLCGERKVRDFCQRSCNECEDQENDDDDSVQYVGCFHDAQESELRLMHSRHMVTVRSCLERCNSKRFTYAALRDGRYCLCGNDYGLYGAVLKRDGCSQRCGGLDPCGGTLENAIYKTDFSKKKKKSYIRKIEELVLGKKKASRLQAREHPKKKHLKVPMTREWNFMDFLRRYEGNENNL